MQIIAVCVCVECQRDKMSVQMRKSEVHKLHLIFCIEQTKKQQLSLQHKIALDYTL